MKENYSFSLIPTSRHLLKEIVSGAVKNVPKNLQSCVVSQQPLLKTAAITHLHCGAVSAILYSAYRQT